MRKQPSPPIFSTLRERRPNAKIDLVTVTSEIQHNPPPTTRAPARLCRGAARCAPSRHPTQIFGTLRFFFRLGGRPWLVASVLGLVLLLAAPSSPRSQAQVPAHPANADLDRLFQQAVSQYESNHYAESAAILEKLLPSAPESFELHELLGLDYSAQSQDAKASPHLEKAARLNPKSAEADTNHNLGEAYIREGKIPDAAPYLEKAQRLDASNYDNGYDLALAYISVGL